MDKPIIFTFIPKTVFHGICPIVIIETSLEKAVQKMEELHENHWYNFSKHEWLVKENEFFIGQYIVVDVDDTKQHCKEIK